MRNWQIALILACASGDAQVRPPAGEVIGDLKAYGRALGVPDTGNFRRHSNKAAASYRCYFTGKLELPATYDELDLRQGDSEGCPVEERKYDVFFYPIEAVASGDSPVTSSLANGSMERMLAVVPHEDLHHARGLERLGTAVSEAAATLIALRTAAEYARDRFGPESPVYKNLAREPELFLAKANIVNRYFAELAALYASVRDGRVSGEQALAAKAAAFARLEAECEAIRPRPASFNACPAAQNNAGLAFDATYTRHYPLIYELHRRLRGDVRATIEALEWAGSGPKRNDAEVVRELSGVM
jgi:hypothetical protein